jgi:predicted metalloprotease with PDZ domain
MFSTLFLLSLIAAVPDPVMQYTISFTDAPRHLIDVELTLPSQGKAEVELMMPTWTPGSYLIREYARNIERIEAIRAADGTKLPIRKSLKNRWVVTTQGSEHITVRYKLYCRELSVRTNWVESDWAFLTGAATFLTPAEHLNGTHRVRLVLPSHWPDVATALPTVDKTAGVTLEASSFDVLVDSPILIGALNIETFVVGDRTHRLATVAADRLWDTKKATEDLVKIVGQHQKFWQDIPYKDYIFLNIAAESGGGLEHDNSSVLMTSRWQQRKRDSYLGWLGLASHEFFHTWNVRRLRPKVLKQYDYEREQLFDELWIAEGITSYYDELLVARSGLMTTDEYLDRLSKTIANLQGTPGRDVQSLADSSKDAWIKLYRPDENAGNSRISYYVKGAVLALLLDAQIQKKTGGSASLDDVMRQLWKNHKDSGYTMQDFSSIVSSIAGQDVGLWLDKHVHSTEELSYDDVMSWYGLQFKTNKPTAANTTPDSYLGAETATVDGKLTFKKILRGSPADQAGVNVDDEWIAIDNYRISGDPTERLSHYRAGDVIQVLLARRGKLLELPLTLGAKPENSWKLELVKESSDDQKVHLKKWLTLPDPQPAEVK